MTNPAPKLVRSRRKNFWEAIYSPEIAGDFSKGNWILPDLGANKKVFFASDLLKAIQTKKRDLSFSKIRFVDCDFTGFFTDFGRAIIFNNCQFQRCDFGSSTWSRAKFTSCSFLTCSFTQSSWDDCEFRKCSWAKMSMAGNETQFSQTFIDNPAQFIKAAYTNLDPVELKARSRDALFQSVRLEETKATVARTIYLNHRSVGDDITFHKTCAVFMLQGVKGRIAGYILDRDRSLKKGRHSVRNYVKAIFSIGAGDIEIGLTALFGFSNKWGLSLARPLSIVAATFAVFSLVYAWAFGLVWRSALMRAFDVTSVAGYTKAIVATDGPALKFVGALNLAIAIFAYTMFFSTAVAKVSRYR